MTQPETNAPEMSVQNEIRNYQPSDTSERPPITITPYLSQLPTGIWFITLVISSIYIPKTAISLDVPLEFDTEEDALHIANRTIAYYDIHHVAPDFTNPQFRHPDDKIALAIPPT